MSVHTRESLEADLVRWSRWARGGMRPNEQRRVGWCPECKAFFFDSALCPLHGKKRKSTSEEFKAAAREEADIIKSVLDALDK